MHEIDELIKGSTDVEVPAEVEERLRGKLVAFRTQVENRPVRRWQWLDVFVRPPALRVSVLTAALVLSAAALLLMPKGAQTSRVFAAAAAQLRTSQSLQYSIVFNAKPYVGVDLTYLAPAYRRINCSWGIEVRTDGSVNKELILMHLTRNYLVETGKKVGNVTDTGDIVEQLKSLPSSADEVLGEQTMDGRKLYGYRLRKTPPGSAIPGLKSFDVWIDAATGGVNRAVITIQEPGKPEYQMFVRDIRVDGKVDRSLFDLTPPEGYTLFGSAQAPAVVPVNIGPANPLSAVVLPMTGSYLQATSALQRVEDYLRSQSVAVKGPPLGRFWSEQHWQAGYPVPAGTKAEAPFELISLPNGLNASAVVKGAWGKDSDVRWSAFFKSVFEQGYTPAGPATEIWIGTDAKPATQSTEMRIPVTKAK